MKSIEYTLRVATRIVSSEYSRQTTNQRSLQDTRFDGTCKPANIKLLDTVAYSDFSLFIHVFEDWGLEEFRVKGEQVGEEFLASIDTGENVHAELLLQMAGRLQKLFCLKRDLLLK